MRQGRKLLLAGLAILAIAAFQPAAHAARAETKSATTTTRASKSLRQYTGWVIALDKSSITVEKRGKKPESKVFARHSEMSTTGEVEKDAKVTVYYRDEDGHAVAHRVVAKPASPEATR